MMTNMGDWTWPELKAEATELAAELENDCDLASASYKAAVMGILVERLAALLEPQPIRRGDVVQVDPATWEGRVRPRLWIVLDIDEYGYAKTGFSPDVPLSRCVRIGRARYYPDGTPVED